MKKTITILYIVAVTISAFYLYQNVGKMGLDQGVSVIALDEGSPN